MATKAETKPTGLALLREPFSDNQISKLPKESRKQIDERKADRNKMVWNCQVCGGHHHKDSVHLDYVGHAAMTDRLLDADPNWYWEPAALTEEGLPAFDRNNGLWIKLTVDGVTRLGYGSADGKQGGDAIKEIIGDALRNAAMRFGAALDLWHKGDLHADDEAEAAPANDTPQKRENWGGRYPNKTSLHKALGQVDRNLRGCGDMDMLEAYLATDEYKDFIKIAGEHMPHYLEGGEPAPEEFIGIFQLEQSIRDELQQKEAA